MSLIETTQSYTFQGTLHILHLWWLYCCKLQTCGHANICTPPHAHVLLWQWRVKSYDAWELYTIHRLQGGPALNAWKNMKLPLFQWSRKNSREKCQPIATGFSLAAGNMDFGSLVFLSSCIMHIVFMQLNTSAGHRVHLRLRRSTE